MLESEPEHQDMLDEGLARHFDVKCLRRIGPRFRAEGRLLKRYVWWSVEGFVWHGDPSKVGQLIALMETVGCRSSSVLGTKQTVHGRRDAEQELEGSATKLAQRASGLIMYISMDRHDLRFRSTTMMSTTPKRLEITKSRLRKVARYLEDTPVPEHVYAYQNEVAECMAFGDSDWTQNRERRRSTTTLLEKLGNHCIRAAAGAFQTLHISTGWGRPVWAIVRGDGTAEIRISSRSGAGKLRLSGVKELCIQELVPARKLVIEKVGTGDNPADVGTKQVDDSKKLVPLDLGGLRLKRSLVQTALSVRTVVLQGCASVAHVEDPVTGVDSRRDCQSFAWWQSYRGWANIVLPRRTLTRRRISDCSKGRLLAMETHGCWRRAGQWKSCGGIVETIGEFAEVSWWSDPMAGGRVGGRDTDMCDEDVVIRRLLGMTSTATGTHSRVPWMRCVERSEPVRPGCTQKERGQLGCRAIIESCALNSGFNARKSVWNVCAYVQWLMYNCANVSCKQHTAPSSRVVIPKHTGCPSHNRSHLTTPHVTWGSANFFTVCTHATSSFRESLQRCCRPFSVGLNMSTVRSCLENVVAVSGSAPQRKRTIEMETNNSDWIVW